MDELVIKEHNFQVAKNKIQSYAESAPKSVTIPRVKETAGLFGLRDHKVTGPELNQCMGEVQTSLISLNNATKAIISEFKEVYNAFEALDKDYISGIVISVNAAKKASDEAKKASDDISKTIGALKATVTKIGEFQKEVRGDISSLKAKAGLKDDALKHLGDIDAIWKDVQTQQSLLSGFEKQLNSFQATLSAVDLFKSRLDKLNHLVEIDSLWDGLYKHYKDYEVFYNRFVAFSSSTDEKFKTQKDDFIRLNEEHKSATTSFNDYSQKVDSSIESLSSVIKDLSIYAERLKSLAHLEDIDNTWDSLQSHYGAYNVFCQDVQLFESRVSEQFSNEGKEISALQTIYKDFHNEYLTFCGKSESEFSKIQKAISFLNQYTDKLKSIIHLGDVDVIWQDLEIFKQQHNELKKAFADFDEKTTNVIGEILEDVSVLKTYKEQLEGLQYLPKIDELWEFTHTLSERTDTISGIVDKHSSDIQAINSNVSDLDSRFSAKSEELSHRIRVNHIIATSTFIIVLTLFVLNLLNIL